MTDATFPDNRGWGIDYPYRGWDCREDFVNDLERDQAMISNSYGWSPNRAAKVYNEAYKLNKDLDLASAPTSLIESDPRPTFLGFGQHLAARMPDDVSSVASTYGVRFDDYDSYSGHYAAARVEAQHRAPYVHTGFEAGAL